MARMEIYMNTKISKIIIIILCLSLCFTFAVGCDTEEEITETEATTATETTFDGIEKSEWDLKFTDEAFQNYTVVFEGKMSVTENGEYDSTSDVWQKIKSGEYKMFSIAGKARISNE